MPIKLCFCTDGIFPESIGGMQRHSLLLINELSKYDIEIVVFHPHNKNLFQSKQNIKEIFVEPIDKNKTYLKECYYYSKRIYNQLQNYKDYIIYSQGLSVWYGIKKIKNIIVNPHGLEPYQAIGRKEKLYGIPFKIIFNKIFNKANFVVSLGGKLTGILKENISNKQTEIVIIPNGTNIPDCKRENKNSETLKVFFVGRFESNKGINILLQAAQELNNEGYTNIEYILGGKGSLFEELKNKYTSSNFIFKGFISDQDLNDYYKEADIFILPTLFEGMPTVVLEAMSYSLPVIVTNVGATAELVNHENGFLIEANNKEAIKDSLIKFTKLSTEEILKMQDNSFRKVKNLFTWEIIAKKHIELFKKITIKIY